MHQNLSSFRLCYLSRNYRNITSSGNKAKQTTNRHCEKWVLSVWACLQAIIRER